MRTRWLLLLVAALVLLAFVLTRDGERVDPATKAPRGQNAPIEKDPDAAALAAALKR